MKYVVASFAGLIAACSSPTASVERGQEIAQANCASCHALDKTSQSPHDEAPPFRLLSQRYPVDNLQEALAEGIVVGHPDMPEFAFAPDDVDALIAFMEGIQTDPAD